MAYDVTYEDGFLSEQIAGHKDEKIRRAYGHMAELRRGERGRLLPNKIRIYFRRWNSTLES